MYQNKLSRNVVVLGDHNHGKSTLLGRLGYDGSSYPDAVIEKYKGEAAAVNQASFYWAWALDQSKAERERGVTMEIHGLLVKTKKFYCNFLDTPGHPDFMKNTIRGCSQAKTALYVVSASEPEFEQAFSEGQIKQQLIAARAMGVAVIIVAVNKMDTVGYSEARFKHIQGQFSSLLNTLGFAPRAQTFVPVSAWEGANVWRLSPNMPWQSSELYCGIDESLMPNPDPDGPFRLSILKFHSLKRQIGGFGAVGTILQGRVSQGDELQLGQEWTACLDMIERFNEPREMAQRREYVSLRTDRKAERGDVISLCNEEPLLPVVSFVAKVKLLQHPKGIKAGYTPVVHIHTDYFACRFESILQKTSGGTTTENPPSAEAGDTIVVKCVPVVPNCYVEPFERCRGLGRFVVMDLNSIVGVGVVMSTEPVA